MRLRVPTDFDILSTGGLLALTLGWITVGLFAGSGTWLAASWDGRPVDFRAAYVPPLVAGLCWVPITIGAVLLTRRAPLHRPLSWRAAMPYGVSLLAVSFVLNVAWAVLMTAAGAMPATRLVNVAAAGGLRWMHVNMGVFAVLVAVSHWAMSSVAPPRPVFRRSLRSESRGRARLLPVDTIDWIGGAGDYSTVHTGDREFLVSERLKTLEADLDPKAFVRIHRSTIVNVARIVELRSLGRGDREVSLECGTTLRVARRRRQALERAIQQQEGKM